MTSMQRQIANAQNAQKSTGPKSPDGKARSSKNALKHGLTAQIAVLPTENPADFQAQLDEWVEYYQPAGPAQRAVIKRAVSAQWKLDRCEAIETERLALRVRHAVQEYDQAQFAAAEALGQRLVMEPQHRCFPFVFDHPFVRGTVDRRVADAPSVLAREMQQSAQGVAWMLRSWYELGEMLGKHKFWDYSEKVRAIRLLGHNPAEILEDPIVQRIFLACSVLMKEHASPPAHTWEKECMQARGGPNYMPLEPPQVQNLQAARPETAEAATAQLFEIFMNETARLRVLKDELDVLDAADRASAPKRAMLDDSHEGVLLRRYETAVEREFHRSIADLMKLRKQPPPEPADPPAQNEPSAEVEANPEVASEASSDPDVPTVLEPGAPRQPGVTTEKAARKGVEIDPKPIP